MTEQPSRAERTAAKTPVQPPPHTQTSARASIGTARLGSHKTFSSRMAKFPLGRNFLFLFVYYSSNALFSHPKNTRLCHLSRESAPGGNLRNAGCLLPEKRLVSFGNARNSRAYFDRRGDLASSFQAQYAPVDRGGNGVLYAAGAVCFFNACNFLQLLSPNASPVGSLFFAKKM